MTFKDCSRDAHQRFCWMLVKFEEMDPEGKDAVINELVQCCENGIKCCCTADADLAGAPAPNNQVRNARQFTAVDPVEKWKQEELEKAQKEKEKQSGSKENEVETEEEEKE